MMKAKSMAARFGVATFVKGALVAAAICMAATSAFADIAMPHIVSHRGESKDRPGNATIKLTGDYSSCAKKTVSCI